MIVLCEACRCPQYRSPSGIVCENGHGEAPSVGPGGELVIVDVEALPWLPVIERNARQPQLVEVPPDPRGAIVRAAKAEALGAERSRKHLAAFVRAGDELLEHLDDDTIEAAVEHARARLDQLDGIVGLPEEPPADVPADVPAAARPVLRWVGSKVWALGVLVPLVQSALRRGGKLIEPFAGSAALTFAVAPSRGLLSDACEPVIALYRALSADPQAVYEALLALVAKFPPSRESYVAVRTAFNGARKRGTAPDVAIAAALIYLNRTSFNALYRENQAGEFNTPWGKRDKPGWPTLEELRQAAKALACVVVKAGDWRPVVGGAHTGDVLFVDSPYEGTFDSYGTPWTTRDHDELAESLEAVAGRHVVVVCTQPDRPEVRARYAWAKVRVLEVPGGHKVGGKGTRRPEKSELLITAGL